MNTLKLTKDDLIHLATDATLPIRTRRLACEALYAMGERDGIAEASAAFVGKCVTVETVETKQ